MKWPLNNIFVTNRLFIAIGIIAGLFAVSFSVPIFFSLAIGAALLTGALVLVDLLILFNRKTRIECERRCGNVLSLSDENIITLEIKNNSRVPLSLEIIDELPYQLQKRDFVIHMDIDGEQRRLAEYQIRPVVRGEYIFRNINIYAASSIGIIRRRFVFSGEMKVPVYPSIIQMKKYELKMLSRISFFTGLKKMRKIGHSYEFDQIKHYVQGDDIRSINWKATGRTGELMVNHYEDEKSQQVFCIIDKSRTMKMPFNNLSLLDYSINSTLTISNIALKKEDRVGLITFSDKIGVTIPPERHHIQLRKILDALYNEKEKFNEANFELLYLHVRNTIKVRSLIFLYTNFESIFSIERAVNILRKINKLHLLVVIFFENSEISNFADHDAVNLEDIYQTTVAEKFVVEKNLIRRELTKYGIQTIISTPEELSINTINKYLELKARGLI